MRHAERFADCGSAKRTSAGPNWPNVLEIRTFATAVVIEPDDDLDYGTIPLLEAAIADAEAAATNDRRIFVSLERCPYCDSSTIGALLRAAARIGDRFFIVVPETSRCHRIFAIASLHRLPFVVDSLPEALAEPGSASG